jgi:hemerythrin
MKFDKELLLLVLENLKQNQLILLYTLIYGVLTKNPILSDTTSQEFCSLLVKYNVSDVEFNKEEKYLRNSILRSLSEYKTTNRYLYELFIKVWVKNKQIVINSNVTDYLYEKAKTFITSNISLDESKLLPTDFKRTLNEQQPKPNQQQQAHQSSASAAALAGLGLGAKKYGPRLMSFLKKIHEKSKGKIYGIGGMIAAILKYTNIMEQRGIN